MNARDKTKRGHLRGQVTKLQNNLDSICAAGQTEVQAALDKILEIEVEIKELDEILFNEFF